MIKRRSVFAIGALAAMFAMPAQGAENVKFVLDWAFQGNHGFFTLAEDNGHFAKEGLKVKIDPCLSGYHPHPLYVVCTHFPE